VVKYTLEMVSLLANCYHEGFTKEQACANIGIPSGSFTYLMRKFGFEIRPRGFQIGNKTKSQFKPKLRVVKLCRYCKSEMRLLPWEIKCNKSFCSLECRSRFHVRKGKEHWNWQGGISKERDLFRHSDQYKNWRKIVYERDHFTCQICGNYGEKLHAHHIKPQSLFPEFALVIDNGMTLCRSCHIRIHTKSLHQGRHR
jgi:5-methylcytosine-specific restriction endonuclease McrA